MTFAQVTPGNSVHVLEITGTFKRNTVYGLGSVINVSSPYDEPTPVNQYPVLNQQKRKLVDLTISCNGEQRKLSVAEDKSITTDASVGLTIATDKQYIIDMVKKSYEDCKIKKAAMLKYDEEMKKCEDILKELQTNTTEQTIESNKELDELKLQVTELRELLLKSSDTKKNITNTIEESKNI